MDLGDGRETIDGHETYKLSLTFKDHHVRHVWLDAKTFLESMAIVKDFWAEPSYAELLQAMQKRVHDFVVADKGTAKEALDGLLGDWKKVFKEDGKIK